MHNGGASGRRRRFAGLRAWNRRQAAWTRRHPWWNAALFAIAYCLPWAWSSLRNEFVSLPFVAVLGLVGFVVSGVLGTARAARPEREPLANLPTDLTLRGDSGPVMGEDGRRWRTGSP